MKPTLNKQLMDCHAQLASTCLFTLFAIVTCKVGQTDLVFGLVRDQGSLVGLCMQDYKPCMQSLRFVPPSLTDRQMSTHTHTHRQHFGQLI